ncbi:arsenate reductase (glutaredoxin) [Thiomonas bhubaneswarensis]|uniref:Arsenate reductase n=1 Tax=Thiomonas bhubaneswarensis TaxID=339866 RepID=A0A0K6I994_9BURK|nr:arsenate reductase (glutaredoxin) [Thiomonas bhubaneswarensis]CUA99705.1 arsenate reductase (glutaredoxin) [Thiomonas bhubaneswarensis]
MTSTRIYHNPQCGTSRNVLALIRHAGIEPEIVEYLKTPPDRTTMLALLSAMQMTPRQLLRRKGTPYDTLGLDDATLTDDALIEAMLAHPILIERPIVVSPKGTRLCRPSETVLELLPAGPLPPFSKEDGEVVIGENGQRPG